MFLEITTRSFDIKISKGDKLNQMRLRKKTNNYLDDEDFKLERKIASVIYFLLKLG